jgi:uncharacterized protein YqiB (DUF1249 family)
MTPTTAPPAAPAGGASSFLEQLMKAAEINYRRLEKLLGQRPAELEFDRAYCFRAAGFMDLIVERLPDCRDFRAPILSLAHYFLQAGDLCADPEMTVRVFEPSEKREHGAIEALTFEMAIPPIFQEVYPEPGKVSPPRHRELNGFLSTWLKNLEEQGHQRVEVDG